MACIDRYFNPAFILLSAFTALLITLPRPSHSIGLTVHVSGSSDIVLSNGRNLICAEYGELLEISCSLKSKQENISVNSWLLSWRSVETDLKINETGRMISNSTIISRMRVQVTWSSEKLLTCFARWAETWNVTLQSWNASVIVRTKPPPVTNITGLSFIETMHGKIVEVLWKPVDSSTSVLYFIKYCLVPEEDDQDEDDLRPICPKCDEKQGGCLLRRSFSNSVTSKCSVATCRAFIQYGYTAPLKIQHKLYVVSQRAECEAEGRPVTFTLQILPSYSQNEDTLLLIPHPVKNLHAMAAKHRTVRISWTDPASVHGRSSNFRKYLLYYNCSENHIVFREKIQKNDITLHGDDFQPYRPYNLCQFCVKAQIADDGVFSKSVCNTTRLHEELPSSAPRITCGGNECDTTPDENRRNVTVTWVLPPQQDWNGPLINVKAVCRRQDNPSKAMEVSVQDVAQGATLLTGLYRNSSYLVQMAACNNEGCSPLSNASSILAELATPTRELSRLPGDSYVTKSTVGSIIAAVVFFIFLLVIVLVWLRHKRVRRGSLPSVSEPHNYDNPTSLPPNDNEDDNQQYWEL